MIRKYPDGSSYAKIPKEILELGSITISIDSYEDLWHLGQILEAASNMNKKMEVEIPFLIDTQADRRFNPNESSGLKLVCKYLNQFNASYRIFHPHNPEVIEALIDDVEIIDNSEFISSVFDYMLENSGMRGDDEIMDNLILMSPDAGGFKQLMKLCDAIDWEGETASASKSREWTEYGSAITQSIPDITSGKDILIIDDICVYGSTFKGLSELIREVNEDCKIYLAVSHMTVKNLGTGDVTQYFDKVFTTNSKFGSYQYKRDRFQVAPFDSPDNLEIIRLFNKTKLL